MLGATQPEFAYETSLHSLPVYSENAAMGRITYSPRLSIRGLMGSSVECMSALCHVLPKEWNLSSDTAKGVSVLNCIEGIGFLLPSKFSVNKVLLLVF